MSRIVVLVGSVRREGNTELLAKAFALSEEDQKQMFEDDGSDWKEIAPSEKLFQAACSLGIKKKVLDYGCGSAWAAIIAAKSGCADVTAVDVAPGAVRAAQHYATRYGVADRVHAVCSDSNWLQSVPDGTFDGLIRSANPRWRICGPSGKPGWMLS